jgi:hypothetical protein
MGRMNSRTRVQVPPRAGDCEGGSSNDTIRLEDLAPAELQQPVGGARRHVFGETPRSPLTRRSPDTAHNPKRRSG